MRMKSVTGVLIGMLLALGAVSMSFAESPLSTMPDMAMVQLEDGSADLPVVAVNSQTVHVLGAESAILRHSLVTGDGSADLPASTGETMTSSMPDLKSVHAGYSSCSTATPLAAGAVSMIEQTEFG